MSDDRILKEATVLIAATVLAMTAMLVAAQAEVGDEILVSTTKNSKGTVSTTWTEKDACGHTHSWAEVTRCKSVAVVVRNRNEPSLY